MITRIAARGSLAPFIAMDVMREANARETSARALAGRRVLHLEVGQPSTPAPARVRDAARTAIATERLGYTDALGLPELRQRIARHYAETYGVVVDWRRIAITTGSSGAFILAFLAAFDPGDRVCVATPGYPAYRNILAALGVDVALLEVGEESRYQPTPSLIDAAGGRFNGLIVASPANPTGTMLDGEALRRLAGYCAARGAWLISDEIYHGITYGAPAVTALAVSDSAIVVNSFSKYYAMTGWRLGWLVLPEALLRPVECLAQNLFISPPTISQRAALHAFDCARELDDNVARYARNRRLLLDGLPRAGFARLAPADGAFYIYAELGGPNPDSVAFARRMLIETDVAATPGIDFDPRRGTRFIRFSFAGETDEISEAIERLIAWRQ